MLSTDAADGKFDAIAVVLINVPKCSMTESVQALSFDLPLAGGFAVSFCSSPTPRKRNGFCLGRSVLLGFR